VAELFHLTERDTWSAAVQAGDYRMSTRGVTLEEQGFIHCSLRHQVSAIAELVFSDLNDDELVVLVIDSDSVPGPIRYEAAEPGGPEFPHIYGPLPVSAVTDTIAISRAAEGHPVLPG
jgi:uncharacterized protein (DUF952 family)